MLLLTGATGYIGVRGRRHHRRVSDLFGWHERPEAVSALHRRSGHCLRGYAARRAKVPTGVHILRHTFCSHLAMHGAPGKAIQELAGHGELSMTQRCMHLNPATREAAIRLLELPGATSSSGEMLETTKTANAS